MTADASAGWKRALGDAKQVAFKSYPKLDHASLEGEGPAGDADYRQPRNVARQVVEEIAAWIKSN